MQSIQTESIGESIPSGSINIEMYNSNDLLICAAHNTSGLLSLRHGTIALQQTMRSWTKAPLWKIV